MTCGLPARQHPAKRCSYSSLQQCNRRYAGGTRSSRYLCRINGCTEEWDYRTIEFDAILIEHGLPCKLLHLLKCTNLIDLLQNEFLKILKLVTTVETHLLSAFSRFPSFGKVVNRREGLDIEIILRSLVLLTFKDSDIDLAFQLCCKLFPKRRHSLAVTAPVRIEHNDPRLFTLHQVGFEVIIIEDSNIISQIIQFYGIAFAFLKGTMREFNDRGLITGSLELLEIIFALLTLWELVDRG